MCVLPVLYPFKVGSDEKSVPLWSLQQRIRVKTVNLCPAGVTPESSDRESAASGGGGS